MLFVPRSTGFAVLGIDGYDPSLCPDGEGANPALPAPASLGLEATLGAVFDGWGYLHTLNNTSSDITVPLGMDGETATVGYLGEMGYYAPAETTDPALATGAGDLTMHNLEIDPANPDRTFISWYSLGMRAVEWRPGAASQESTRLPGRHYHPQTFASVAQRSLNLSRFSLKSEILCRSQTEQDPHTCQLPAGCNGCAPKNYPSDAD